MVNSNLFRAKAIIVALVILGSFVGLVSTSVPSAFAADTVNFYSTPNSATITVDNSVQVYGWAGTFAPGDRVLVIANPPMGAGHGWEFVGWAVNGVSVDNPLSQNTYITIGQGQGSVTAIWRPNITPISHATPHLRPPPEQIDDDRDNID